MDRYIVACYDSAVGGHFYRHRDNVNVGAQHRRFAVTINLNNDYDGCDLVFPEFGRRAYRAPHGGAIVFSCGALHQVTPVTAGDAMPSSLSSMARPTRRCARANNSKTAPERRPICRGVGSAVSRRHRRRSERRAVLNPGGEPLPRQNRAATPIICSRWWIFVAPLDSEIKLSVFMYRKCRFAPARRWSSPQTALGADDSFHPIADERIRLKFLNYQSRR